MRTRRAALAALLLGVPAILLGRKAWVLSAGPSAAKDCGPPGDPAAPPPGGDDGLPWSARGGTVNDVSCLSRTPVRGVVAVTGEDEIAAALGYARDHGLDVSMAGARHSMGGHAFAKDGLVLDMTGFNAVRLNPDKATITVQSGATWHDIQNAIHPGFAVLAMQSSDVFTVGGSISVNAHGMDHQVGAIERTIRGMRVMLADGSVVPCSRTENEDLYRHVVGGYGLFGVILDVELDVARNDIYRSARRTIAFEDFPDVFENDIASDNSIRLFYGHLSTAPDSLLRETILYSYHQTGIRDAEIPPLGDVSMIGLRRLVFNLSKEGGFFRRLKWYMERTVEPKFESCTITRAEAQGEAEQCLVSRNEPMHDSVPYLFNRLDYETDILHEYFVPRSRVVEFVNGARTIMQEHDTVLLNASIRVVHKEEVALNYAPEDAFSLVFYINQTVDEEGIAKMARLTGALIDLAHEHGGRFFLPYQKHYSAAQLKRSYPAIGNVFARKRHYDPDERFSNNWYAKYAGTV